MTQEPPTILYIGAHDVDFLVRAGGTLRKYALLGSRIVAVSLTFGERQESERLWRERPGITLEEVKQTRLAESQRCAELVGCEFRCLDWNDSPIVFDRERLYALAALIQEIRPSALITHWSDEITNYDHLDTATAVRRAAQYASTGGSHVETGREAWRVPTLLFSEPSFPFPDINRFRPNIWIDITEEYETKLEGLRAAWSHGHLDRDLPAVRRTACLSGTAALPQRGHPLCRGVLQRRSLDLGSAARRATRRHPRKRGRRDCPRRARWVSSMARSHS